MSVLSAILWALALATLLIAGLMLVGWSYTERPLQQKWLAWSCYFATVLGLVAFGLGARALGVLGAAVLGGPALSAFMLFAMWSKLSMISGYSDQEALEERRFKRVPPRDLESPPRDD